MKQAGTQVPDDPSRSFSTNLDVASIDRAVQSILDARTPRDLKRATARLTVSLAPRDLMAALTRNRQPFRDSLAELLGVLLPHRSARRKGLRWQRTTLAELRGWPESGSWRARQIRENATFFENPAVASSQKTLVVGIAGNSQQLMVPSYKILRALGSHRANLLLLRDPHSRSYGNGIAGIGANPSAVSAFVGAFARDGGYERTIALATSAGGPFGIFAALSNGWERVVAIGPDDPGNHLALLEAIRHLSASGGRKVRVDVCFAAGNTVNSSAARAIAKVLPDARLFPIEGPDQHNLLEIVADSGEIDAYLGWHCFDDPPKQPLRWINPGFTAERSQLT